MAAVPTRVKRLAAARGVGDVARRSAYVGARFSGAAAGRSRDRIISLVPATTGDAVRDGRRRPASPASATTIAFRPRSSGCRKVGGLLDPERRARSSSLKPDLVIVYDTQADLKRQLERAQDPDVSATSHRGLADITADDARARRARRREGRAPTPRPRASSSSSRRSAPASPGGRGRRRCWCSGASRARCGTVNASGGYGFLHDVLELAGGADVLGDLNKQSVDMSTEMILTRAPEVILELHYGDSLKPRTFDAERRVWNALPSVPAVKNKRVYLLDGDEFVVPGPRIVLAAERFARTLHPAAER